MKLEEAVKLLEGFFYVGSIITFVFGLYTYKQSLIEKSKQDTYEKYRELQNRYLRHLELSLENPEIGFGEYHSLEHENLSSLDKNKQRQLFFIFINVMEEAYLMRHSMEPSQWIGWDGWIKQYCAKSVFQKLWFNGEVPRIGYTNFLSWDFEAHMENVFIDIGLLEAKPKVVPRRTPLIWAGKLFRRQPSL
jgi:hypothetical protein